MPTARVAAPGGFSKDQLDGEVRTAWTSCIITRGGRRIL